MKITLFGGAFDPPHLGHEQVTSALLTHNIADEVWYVPVKQHPFGKQLQTTDEHRLAMLQLIAQPRTCIETFELTNDEANFSYITLRTLSERYVEHTFSWVIGSDNLASFHKWGFYEQMLKAFTFYVYPRTGFGFEPLYPGMIPMREMPEVEVSSTTIRERIKNNQSFADLLNPKVAAYIAQHDLYR